MGAIFANPAEGLDFRCLQEEERRGISAAERLQPLQHVQGIRGPGPEGNNQIIFHGGQETFLRRGGGNGFLQAALKQGDVFCLYGQARCLFMAAETLQQIRTGGKHPVDIDAGNGTAGADGGIPMDAEGDGRQMETLAQASRGKPDKPGIPVLPGDNDHMRLCQNIQIQLGEGRGCHFPFQALPGTVGFLQQTGNMSGLGGIRRQQQMHAELCVSQAAGGVKPGAEAERQVVGGDRGLQSGVLHQGLQTRP